MPPRIQILDKALRNLQNAREKVDGYVFGILYEGNTLIMGFSYVFPKENQPACRATSSQSTISIYNDVLAMYPTGIDFCGLMTIRDDLASFSSAACTETLENLKNVAVTNNPVYLTKSLCNENIECFYYHEDLLYNTEYEVLPYAQFREKFIFLHLQGKNISVSVPYKNGIDDYQKEMKNLTERMANGLVFRVSSSDLFIYKYNMFNSLTSTIGKVYDASLKYIDRITDLEVLNIYAFFPTSVCIKREHSHGAPYLVDYSCCEEVQQKDLVFYDKTDSTLKINLELPFDVLCIVQRERSLNDIYSLLIDASERILMASESHFTMSVQNPLSILHMKMYHFLNDHMCYPISVIFMTEQKDEELVELRKIIHDHLGIPLDRPKFRRSNSLNFLSITDTSHPLVNVHSGLHQRSSDHTWACVYGKYEFYHYTMNNLNDKGWGCAYRSLQTIFSWFRLQGYTTDPVPTHLEIQQTLVDIKDKAPEFLGSNTWIGSTEVSFVLQQKLDVDSQIINLSSGSEMSTVGELLLEHFRTHGTPVMIGGGVLAHTIIGVSFNSKSGLWDFLILDPHYTGPSNGSSVCTKGGVGWKGVSYWDSSAFYNLCLPQRPYCF